MTQQGQWQLTGSAAEKYEQVVVPYGFETWARELVEDNFTTWGFRAGCRLRNRNCSSLRR